MFRAIDRRARNRVTHQRRMAMGGLRVGTTGDGRVSGTPAGAVRTSAAGRKGAAPVAFTNLITPPGRTREPHHRDDRDAGREPQFAEHSSAGRLTARVDLDI